MHDAQGLAAEQTVVNVLYARLDAIRDEAAARLDAIRREGPSGSPQNRSERDAFATLYEDRIAQLDAVEDRLCFGRLDQGLDDRFYVGRIGLSDATHAPLLTDWRAPAARSFYSATAANPAGVVSRRHLTTIGREVTAIEDDVLDVEALRKRGDASELAGEGALLAALDARRTGKMTDIVATIQAEQDAVIRSPMSGALVVQGGPGTGKTAVALHRAAYLLYHHREQLERSGVLLIGPSKSFLRYIDRVLPSLGETGAISTTLGGLVRNIDTQTIEDDAVAEVKGRLNMAAVIKAAVRERQRVPRTNQEISIDGRIVIIKREDVRSAQAQARHDGRPHNVARSAFAKDMLSRLATQIVDQLGESLGADDREDIARDLRDSRDIRVALNLMWLPITASQLLADLYRHPHLLRHAAPQLTAAECGLLHRPATGAFTDADVPLLDEAAELLGELPGRKKRTAAISSEELDYARQSISNAGARGMVSADDLARRMQGGRSGESVAERASRDRTWTFGHIVVDEAQELSPMAWRMLLRRCPSRSFTIVGDVAQTAAGAGTRWWPETFDRLFGENWALRELTVSYRIPADVADVAQSYARAAGLPASELTAARDAEDSVRFTQAEDALAAALQIALDCASMLERTGGGEVAIIAPPVQVAGLRADVEAEGMSVLTPREAKGLEFDVVVLVDPATIAAHPGDLYVALTRPIRSLEVVYQGSLPAGLQPAG